MSIAKKLQIKPEHTVAVLHQPGDVDLDITQSPADVDPPEADAVLVFVTNRIELGKRADPVIAAARRDALAWIAYPKAGKLGTDLSRDSLWELLQDSGVRPVRQVAIDDVWSALRFRPA